MICKICGKDYSASVYPLHKKRCKPVEKEVVEEVTEEVEEEVTEEVTEEVEEVLRRIAKDNDISNYWNKNIDNLKEELKEKELI